jgi:hypothetical protein
MYYIRMISLLFISFIAVIDATVLIREKGKSF